MATAPLLNIETLTDHPIIVIDGTAYDLLMPDALPVLDYIRTDRLRTKFAEATTAPAGGTDYAPDASKEVDGILDQLVRIVLKAPDVVHARLTSGHRLSIYQTFMQQQNASGSLSKKRNPEARRAKGKKAIKRRSTGVY